MPFVLPAILSKISHNFYTLLFIILISCLHLLAIIIPQILLYQWQQCL